jgi:mono/diheme cytochrome c family protein
MKKKYSIAIILIAMVIILLVLSPVILRLYWKMKASNPVNHGAKLALAYGCNNCHAPWGGHEIKNPNSRLGTIPSFSGGNLMMYVSDKSQVEDYIRFGHVKGKKPPSNQLIIMPPFASRVTEDDEEDLEAFVLAANAYELPQEGKIADGYEEALEHGCFSCHGVAGAGGMNNPGSFKGYIPGWWGSDYKDLVRNDQELDQWIRNGISDRFKNSKLARYFLSRQAISMPAFGDSLTPSDYSAIASYIQWQRKKSGA